MVSITQGLYNSLVGVGRIELPTHALSGRYSTAELHSLYIFLVGPVEFESTSSSMSAKRSYLTELWTLIYFHDGLVCDGPPLPGSIISGGIGPPLSGSLYILYLHYVAPPAEFESATLGSEDRCSVQLSYGGSVLFTVVEPNQQSRQTHQLFVDLLQRQSFYCRLLVQKFDHNH